MDWKQFADKIFSCTSRQVLYYPKCQTVPLSLFDTTVVTAEQRKITGLYLLCFKNYSIMT